MHGDGPSSRRTVTAMSVPGEPGSVARVRSVARAALVGSDLPVDTVDTALLLLSELVTNAVLHARTEITVELVVADGVRVEVQDDAPGIPTSRDHSVDSITGRGLEIVQELADDFGVSTLPDGGKTVWFVIDGRTATSGPRHDPATYLNSATNSATSNFAMVDAAPDQLSVRLNNVSVLLFTVMREHNEALLREFALHRLASSDGDIDPTPALVAATTAVRQRIAAAVAAAGQRSPDARHVDVAVPADLADVEALGLLLRVMQEADSLSDRGQILTRPAVPELRRMREWLIAEFESQADGEPPRPWATPDVLDVEPLALSADVRQAVEAVRADPGAAVLARAEDQIVAASTAALHLLGWTWDELAGRRVTVLIPPDLRDAHIAGLTRHLMTGEETMLGREVSVRAWHHDGRAVPVVVALSRWPGVRSLYVARFTPLPSLDSDGQT